MKRSAYAGRVGVHDKTAWRWWRAGNLDASQAASGTLMVREPAIPSPATHHVAISARVSAAEKRPTLEARWSDSSPVARPRASRRIRRIGWSTRSAPASAIASHLPERARRSDF